MQEAFAANAVAKRVAERHEISTGLLFTSPWQHRSRQVQTDMEPQADQMVAKKRNWLLSAGLFTLASEGKCAELPRHDIPRH